MTLRIDELRYADVMFTPIYRAAVLMTGCLITGGALVGQSRDELKRAYGDPISETFAVRPDIQVTVSRAEGAVAELIVAPRKDGTDGLVKSRGDGLSRESVDAVLDELVPVGIRGKHVVSGFVNMACLPANDCNGSTRTYEKVTIYYNAASEGRIYYAVLKWNKKPVPLPISR